MAEPRDKNRRLESLKRSVVVVIEGKASIIGGRGQNQDFVWTGQKKEGTRWGVVADGHGPDGGDLALRGGKALVNEYKRLRDRGLVFSEAARYAFNRVHSSLVTEKQQRDLTGGTTAVLFDIDNLGSQPELRVAHAGDSRATLINLQTGNIDLITAEHNASNPVEAEDVRKRGGRVEGARVAGRIQVTRSLGDTYTGMTPEPEAHTVLLNPGSYLLLVYTDGLSQGLKRYGEIHPESSFPSIEALVLAYFQKYRASRSLDQITEDLTRLGHEGFTQKRLQRGGSLEEEYGDNVTLLCSTIDVQ